MFYKPAYGDAGVSDKASTQSAITKNTDVSANRRLIDLDFGSFSFDKGTSIVQLAKNSNKTVIDYEGVDANKDNLIATHDTRLLHISSHGFFVNDKSIDNPMLKAGLALAGARAGELTGKVTALDLMGLNLSGTDTVVLSACDTGKVDVSNTQSVSVLNKAFIQDGASSVIMSLWSVPIKETTEIMQSYYEILYANPNLSQAEALRKAKLKLINESATIPLVQDWAGFVVSGG